MAKIRDLAYHTWDGQSRVLDFIGAQAVHSGIHTTLLTGHNGSHKSTILKELVASLAIADHKSRLTLNNGVHGPIPVICASGSVADRFPPKEQGGRPTIFDVPNYVYIGQRVGTNLLSKKLPLETMVSFALNRAVINRFAWPFYEKAFRLAGIAPMIDLEFRHAKPIKQSEQYSKSLIELVNHWATTAESGKNERQRLSAEMALYLKKEFSEVNFNEFDRDGKSRGPIRIQLRNGEMNVVSPGLSTDAIRLGLLSDQLSLVNATVYPLRGKEKFSIYELSSGEYHLLTTILALGFSVEDGAIILIDEPENSLHPQWQQEFMDTLFEICSFMHDGHVVISTHSPLIVSSAPINSTILDLSSSFETNPAVPVNFGASADEILFEQFGIASSRNRAVVEVVQRAVELTEKNLASSEEFIDLIEQLYVVRSQLRPNDPLKEVIDALTEE